MDADYPRRFLTFANFPHSSPALERQLAAAGFVYRGDGINDEIVCSQCGKCFRNWNSGELPFLVHKRQSPNCPFVTTHERFNKVLPDQPERMDFYDSQPQVNAHNMPQQHNLASASSSVLGNPVCQPSEDVEDPQSNSINATGQQQPQMPNGHRVVVKRKPARWDLPLHSEMDDTALGGQPMLPVPNRNDDDDDEYEIVRTAVLNGQPSMNNHVSSRWTNFVPSMQQNNNSQARLQEQSLQEAKTHVRQILGCSEDIIQCAIGRVRDSGVTNITVQVLMNAVLDEQPVDTLPAHNQTSVNGPPSDVSSTAENVPNCKVCLTRELEVLILPCRHLVCCEQCATRVQKCPFCRGDIAHTVKTLIPGTRTG